MSSVAIVILNWNGRNYLEQFLPFLLSSVENSPEARVIVADNGSTDDSLDLLNTKFPTVEIITFDKNYGFSEGYNKALKVIESDYYVLLNSDVEVTSDWLHVLLDYMDANPDVAACQPKILSWHNRDYFEYAGASGGFIDKFGYPFCRGRIFGTIEEDHGQYDDIRDVFWATGACLFIRSEDYWNVGGLDNDFFAHQEEIDLCWRLKSRGRRIVCNPQSVVYHVGGGTLSTENPQKTYLNFRNNLLMLYKNLPRKSLKSVFRIRFYLDNMAAAHFLIQGRFNNLKAVTDARTDFRNMQANFSVKRNENILQSVRSTFKEISQDSLFYEYYFKGHKKFSELSHNNELIVDSFQEEDNTSQKEPDKKA